MILISSKQVTTILPSAYVSATSFSWSRYMRANGQSSTSPSQLPTDSVLIIIELAMGHLWSRNL